MISARVTIPAQVAAVPTLAQLKGWGADMAAFDYSVMRKLVNGKPMGQFSHYVPVFLDAGGQQIINFSANQFFSTLNNAEWLKILALQIADEKTVAQKAGWLTNGGDGQWGSPMRALYANSAAYRTPATVDLIGALWAGQQVEILESRTFPKIQYNNDMVFTNVTLHRVRTFTDADWGKTFFTHPQIVPMLSAVDGGDKPIKPQGTIYMPVIFRRAASCWVFREWLISG